MDHYRWSERYYRAAESIAIADKMGSNIFNCLDQLWPAGLKGHNVHYSNRPFDNVQLISAESLSDCVIAPPLRGFRFDPEKVWPEENTESSIEQFDTPKVNRNKRQLSDGELEADESDEDTMPKDSYKIFFHKNNVLRKQNV